VNRTIQSLLQDNNPGRFMKNATLLRVGQESVAARWFGLLAIAALLPLAVSLKAQTPTITETTVTTLGGGPQYYNPGHSFGSSNSVYGTLYSQFHTPSGIAYDSFQGYLYVADRDNNAIRLIDHSANPSEIFTFAPDPPYVPANLISQPVGVAVDAMSDVFVLNRGNGANGTVVEFDYLGNLIATNMTKLTNASGIALDTVGDIYVTTRNTVFKITPAGVSNVVVTITNAGTFLQGIVVKRSGPSAGWLAVCDSGRNGIYLINPASGAVTTNAGFNGAGDGTGNRNQGVFNANARFFQPSGLAEAGDGSLIVTDFGNHRVKVVTVAGLTTNLYGVSSNDWWGGPGATTPTGGAALPGWSDGAVWEPDGGPGFGNVQARMPFGVAFGYGPDGTTPTIYVTEDYYHILRTVTGANLAPPPPWPPPPPTEVAATAGYGQVLLTWTGNGNPTNYNIKRSTSSGGQTNGILASTTGTSYTDITNLLDGTTYYYVVSAANTGGPGQNSTEVSATPQFSPAPTSLIVVTTNFGLVSLVWSPSAGATSYNLKRAPSHGGPYAPLASTASTSYNDTAVIDGETYYYVVTAVNAGGENPTNSPEVSGRPPLPPVPDPQIGYVDFPPTAFTSVFHPVSSAGVTFNNDSPPYMVIIGAAGSQTYYTYSNTPAVTNVPDPTSTSSSAPVGYLDGLSISVVANLTVAQILPNVAIRAVGEQPGHPNSAIVSALFQFVVGNPGIYGANAALFAVSNITVGAQMYYTIDGSDPTNDGSGTSIGPISSGTSLSLNVVSSNLQFKIRGFRANYQPSGIVTNLFSAANFVANAISFGTPHGEPSSKFMARPGQFYYAPVTLEMLPGFGKMYSLQFNVTVTNGLANTNKIVNGAGIDFFPMLMTQVTPEEGQYFPPADGNWYLPIPALILPTLVPSKFVNTNNNLLGIGWLYRTGFKYKFSDTNGNVFVDFDTTKQDLTAYSIAHDTLFTEANGKIVVGAYSFQIPANANIGDKYFIQLGSPSATSDGVGAPGAGIYIAPPPTNQVVTVGSPAYLVGDAAPFHWLNAGDFGDTNLDNSDVQQVYQSAILGVDMPPVNSDLYRALDSCGNLGISNAATGYFTDGGPYLALFPVTNTATFYDFYLTNNLGTLGPSGSSAWGTNSITNVTILPSTNIFVITTNYVYTYTNSTFISFVTNSVTNIATFYNPNFNILFDGSDQTINQVAFGDGILDIADLYVTFRRSLDPSLLWFERYWTNGQFVAVTTPNLAFNTNIPSAFLSKSSGKLAPAFQSDNGSQPPSVSFVASDAQGSAGHIVQIPITANVFGSYPLRVLGLNLTVYPLDGSSDLTQPVQFTPAAGLGQPTAPFSSTKGNDSYAAAWLDSTISGLSGNATIGILTITLPASATSMSAYAVHFNVASGSPNGLGVFPKQTWTGLITLSSRTNSYYHDGIPDSWRLRWFGTVYNLLSVSNACPSGDGVNNWAKYVAGVDPSAPNDFPSLNAKTPVPSGATAAIHWPTVSGKQYVILRSSSLFPGSWTAIATNTGTGTDMEFDDNTTGTVKFYRVLILP
jgi:hypothetical protein